VVSTQLSPTSICRIATRISCGHGPPQVCLGCADSCVVIVVIYDLWPVSHIGFEFHKSAFCIASGERPSVRGDPTIESSLWRILLYVYTSLPCHLLARSRQNGLGPRCADNCRYCNIKTRSFNTKLRPMRESSFLDLRRASAPLLTSNRPVCRTIVPIRSRPGRLLSWAWRSDFTTCDTAGDRFEVIHDPYSLIYHLPCPLSHALPNSLLIVILYPPRHLPSTIRRPFSSNSRLPSYALS